MKLWLDDIRPAPIGWTLATTAAKAIEILAVFEVEEISFDHDLGIDGGDGAQVAAWVEQQAATNGGTVPAWAIHSANPVGRARIQAAMESAERFCAERTEP